MGWLDKYPLWYFRYSVFVAYRFVWLGGMMTVIGIVGIIITIPSVHWWKLGFLH